VYCNIHITLYQYRESSRALKSLPRACSWITRCQQQTMRNSPTGIFACGLCKHRYKNYGAW